MKKEICSICNISEQPDLAMHRQGKVMLVFPSLVTLPSSLENFSVCSNISMKCISIHLLICGSQPRQNYSHRMAYDGKGNAVVKSLGQLEPAMETLGGQQRGLYGEKWVNFTKVEKIPSIKLWAREQRVILSKCTQAQWQAFKQSRLSFSLSDDTFIRKGLCRPLMCAPCICK